MLLKAKKRAAILEVQAKCPNQRIENFTQYSLDII
jgi:hypothetical protein